MSRLQPISGTEIVDDIRLGHTWDEYNALLGFIKNQHHQWFVEVGVHEGGLSYLLLPELSGEKDYLGIELDCGLVRPEVKSRYKEYPSELLCANCFSTDVSIRVSSMSSKIIYCDGGNKAKELAHFKHFCKKGDIIMSHDFHDGKREIKGVPDVHPEVTPEDVRHLDLSHDFVRVGDNEFKKTRIIGWRKTE